jgi:dTDP-glucose pyrophosphorylase
MGSKVNIVIPMAGAGSRFYNEGYSLPKPFIDIQGKMMIEHVLNGLSCPRATYTLIVQEAFLLRNKDCLDKLMCGYDIQIQTVERLTQGATCTALAVYKLINNKTPVIFADADNIFKHGIVSEFLSDSVERQLDGSLLTFESNQECFSFVELDSVGLAIRTAEKKVISNHAIAGVYYFKHGECFVDQAIQNMIYNDRVGGEYYMSHIYNYLIKNNGKVGNFSISNDEWDCVGTPKLLREFVEKGGQPFQKS